jgi:hypothetical protein
MNELVIGRLTVLETGLRLDFDALLTFAGLADQDAWDELSTQRKACHITDFLDANPGLLVLANATTTSISGLTIETTP